jgi:hypothetical protein
LTDTRAAEAQRADLQLATQLLGEGADAPSLRAARAMVEFVRKAG